MNSWKLVNTNLKSKLLRTDIGICLVIFAIIYFAYGEPMIVSVFAVSMALAVILNYAISFISRKNLCLKNCLIVALAMTFCVTFPSSSHAFILQNAETAMTTVLTATGGTIDTNTISGFFVFLRIIVLLGFLGGIVVAIARGSQGGEWQPIVAGLGVAVFGIIAIEVTSNMILGGVG